MATRTNQSPSGRKVSLKQTVTFASVAVAATAIATVTASFPGAKVGNSLTLNPRAALGTGVVISNYYVSADDTIVLTYASVSAAVTPAAATFDACIRKV